jgi:hypothetical protein
MSIICIYISDWTYCPNFIADSLLIDDDRGSVLRFNEIFIEIHIMVKKGYRFIIFNEVTLWGEIDNILPKYNKLKRIFQHRFIQAF